MRSEVEIQREIEKLKVLKPQIPQTSTFGDDNLAAIKAQITVLEQRMGSIKVYDVYDRDGNEYVLDAAVAAFDWMDGESDEAPSDDWKNLVRGAR